MEAHMYKISYVGDGLTSEFLFAFPFFQDADIKVALDEKLLSENQYSVYANEDFDGGTVIFSTPPAEDVKIDIFRQISLSRVVDYQPTAKIDPESLNSDFNFLLEAFKDLHSIEVNVTEWANIHDNVMNFLNYNLQVIEDKLSGGAVLGLYNNLVSVLESALPKLINDYGSITETALNENKDDYGLL